MKILDCSLRDGGYYVNWDFEEGLVSTYLESIDRLPVDYIEVGYRSKPMNGYLGEFFYCPVQVLASVKEKTSKKIAIILNEKDVRSEDVSILIDPVLEYIDLVRIAVDPINFERALKLAKEIKKRNLEVAFNVMYMSTWKENKVFLEQLKYVNEDLVDYFYMVDSFGGIYPNDLVEIMNIVKKKTNVKLGFHGHNNLELAMANTLKAIENGIDIVDSTVTGMGRGAGNLKTEILLTVLNSMGKLNFQYNDLSKVVDEFTILKDQYKWGTNLPYMVSGANSLPQKQVMEWVSKRYYSFNSIIRALNNQSIGVKDNKKLPILNFKSEKKYNKALIIGGGKSAVSHSKAIKSFLEINKDIVVIHASSKNAISYKDVNNYQYYCLVGNEGYRLEKVFANKKIEGRCILPPFPRAMGTYIPEKKENESYELEKVDFTDLYKDSHTALAFQSAIEFGVKEVLCIGYDGYLGNISKKEQELFMENEYLFSLANDCLKSVLSLTPTTYTKLKPISIYSKLNEYER